MAAAARRVVVETAGAGAGETLRELVLTHASHLLRPDGAVQRHRLNEHGATHIGLAVDITGHLVQRVPLGANACWTGAAGGYAWS